MSSQKLFLFDIDGTLLKGLDSYGSSLGKAIKKIFQRNVKIDLTNFHGLTDKKILSEILKQNKISYKEKEIDICLNLFGDFYLASQKDTIILPYVRETLQKLKENRNLLGVVTGNVEKMARKKFALYNLNSFFPFGAFGQEAYDRVDLIKLALTRAKDYNWNGDKSKTFYVGDTPRDIKAGKQAGLIKIALTTGNTKREKLQLTNPDYLFDCLLEIIHLNNS